MSFIDPDKKRIKEQNKYKIKIRKLKELPVTKRTKKIGEHKEKRVSYNTQKTNKKLSEFFKK